MFDEWSSSNDLPSEVDQPVQRIDFGRGRREVVEVLTVPIEQDGRADVPLVRKPVRDADDGAVLVLVPERSGRGRRARRRSKRGGPVGREVVVTQQPFDRRTILVRISWRRPECPAVA